MADIDMSLLEFGSYGDYLDSFTTKADSKYLGDRKLCRLIAQLGYRSRTGALTQEQFELNKFLALETLNPIVKSGALFSYGITTSDPVLKQLALRETPNIQKNISTIIFLKIRKKSGFEISGYIDYEQSLRMANRKADNCVDWLGVFQERVLLKPSPTNLSYYDWKCNIAKFNNSDNYMVVHDVTFGLTFLHRGDHKKICVHKLNKKYAQNFSRSVVFSNIYGYVIFYDHIIRKKI